VRVHVCVCVHVRVPSILSVRSSVAQAAPCSGTCLCVRVRVHCIAPSNWFVRSGLRSGSVHLALRASGVRLSILYRTPRASVRLIASARVRGTRLMRAACVRAQVRCARGRQPTVLRAGVPRPAPKMRRQSGSVIAMIQGCTGKPWPPSCNKAAFRLAEYRRRLPELATWSIMGHTVINGH
jgi:hypothetical protein